MEEIPTKSKLPEIQQKRIYPLLSHRYELALRDGICDPCGFDDIVLTLVHNHLNVIRCARRSQNRVRWRRLHGTHELFSLHKPRAIRAGSPPFGCRYLHWRESYSKVTTSWRMRDWNVRTTSATASYPRHRSLTWGPRRPLDAEVNILSYIITYAINAYWISAQLTNQSRLWYPWVWFLDTLARW